MTEVQTAHDLGPLPAQSVLWGPHGITGYTDEQMRVERLRCYTLGEAAERELAVRVLADVLERSGAAKLDATREDDARLLLKLARERA